MAQVKIYLEKEETLEGAEEDLLKALQHHRTGVEHRETFHQPAARDVFRKLLKAHEKALKAIFKEVEEVIDEEIYE